MIARNRTMAALFAGLTAGVLTLVLPVEAQVPSTAPVVKPTDTVNLTMEQRHVVKEIILKDMKVSALQDQATKMPTQVGETVPSGIPLQPMPVEVSSKIPQLKTHSFVVKDDKVIIVDTKDNKVAALIE
jgi:hypothetical protein